MSKKIVTLGEIMLRLSTPDFKRFVQADSFDVTYGGGEANVAAALKEQFQWFWVGFYVVKNNELVLGPFQGPVACTRIQKGRGVCGTAWARAETLIVPDVAKFRGHIACNSLSKSEIVVPVKRNGEVVAVLDIDSEAYNVFDDTDKKYLEEIAGLINF